MPECRMVVPQMFMDVYGCLWMFVAQLPGQWEKIHVPGLHSDNNGKQFEKPDHSSILVKEHSSN